MFDYGFGLLNYFLHLHYFLLLGGSLHKLTEFLFFQAWLCCFSLLFLLPIINFLLLRFLGSFFNFIFCPLSFVGSRCKLLLLVVIFDFLFDFFFDGARDCAFNIDSRFRGEEVFLNFGIVAGEEFGSSKGVSIAALFVFLLSDYCDEGEQFLEAFIGHAECHQLYNSLMRLYPDLNSEMKVSSSSRAITPSDLSSRSLRLEPDCRFCPMKFEKRIF